jgi:hypothetical protein
MVLRRRPCTIRLATLSASALAVLLFGGSVARVDAAKTKRNRRQGLIVSPFDARKRALPRASLVTIAGRRRLSQPDYDELRDGAQVLLRRYDPRRHFFVAVGRSCAPMVALLQNLGGKELAINFPGQGSGAADPWTFARYVEKLVPRSALRGRHLVLLHDAADWGSTLGEFGRHFGEYLDSVDRRIKVKKVAFYQGVREGLDEPGIEKIDTFRPDRMRGGLSEYGSHEMGVDDLNALVPRQGYRRFQRALLRRMKRDGDLHRFVEETLGASSAALRQRWPAAWTPGFRRFDGRRRGGKPSRRPLLSLETTLRAPHPARDGRRPVEVETRFDYLSQADYEQLRDGVLQLLRKTSPLEAFFLGVGPGSAPLVAMLEIMGSRIGAHLPIDWLNRDARRFDEPDEMVEKLRAQYDQAFDAFLPRQVSRGERELVLFSAPGRYRSLGLAGELLEDWVQRRGASRIQVSRVALDHAVLPELRLLTGPKYELVAPYRKTGRRGGRPLLIDGQPRRRSSNYLRFKEALAQRMSSDPVIRAAIDRLRQGRALEDAEP